MLIEDVGWKVGSIACPIESTTVWAKRTGTKGGGGSEGNLIPLVAVCPATRPGMKL
jgi:hypothetical protein